MSSKRTAPCSLQTDYRPWHLVLHANNIFYTLIHMPYISSDLYNDNSDDDDDDDDDS